MVNDSRSKRKASSGDFNEENPMQNENLQFLHIFDKEDSLERPALDNNIKRNS
jgi:hypothetical protein